MPGSPQCGWCGGGGILRPAEPGRSDLDLTSWAAAPLGLLTNFLPIFLLLQVCRELRGDLGCLDHLALLGSKGTMVLLETQDPRETVEPAVRAG